MATEYCYGCGGELILENAWMADGCPCNSPAGCNATNVGRWRLLERLQQEHQRDLSARGVQVNQLTANLEQVTAERDELREALERIEKWFGEFPETNKFWPDGSPMSYGTCYGSNGERDYMRELARIALAKGGA